jgi:putative restriction endonuclease
MVQKIKINDLEFEVLDAKEKMTVPDCWVLKNKIEDGHGEAKFYIGNEGDMLFSFFDDFTRPCFILKSDLLKYLEEVKTEYHNPEQPYKNKKDLPDLWKKYYDEINSFEEEILYFNIEHQDQITPPRVYINSGDSLYKLIRKISLPNVTYLSALKLKTENNEIVYYWKLFVDYFGEHKSIKEIEKEEDEIIEDETLSETEKETIVRARKGQGEYRKKLLDECPICPITMVSDDRLLIASHIKPWARSEKDEKTDPKNGFMFTPTYDFLFDRGFITFTNEQKMVVSPWLSKMTCSKLSLVDGKKYPLLPMDEKRVVYLEYHKTKIFKG